MTFPRSASVLSGISYSTNHSTTPIPLHLHLLTHSISTHRNHLCGAVGCFVPLRLKLLSFFDNCSNVYTALFSTAEQFQPPSPFLHVARRSFSINRVFVLRVFRERANKILWRICGVRILETWIQQVKGLHVVVSMRFAVMFYTTLFPPFFNVSDSTLEWLFFLNKLYNYTRIILLYL